MRNIAKYPHASGEARVSGRDGQEEAHAAALRSAVSNFQRIYQRDPDWDFVNFRGAHSTITVVVEIWEEEH